MIIDYDCDDRIVSVDFSSAAMRMGCHFFNTAESVDGKLPLALNWDYNPEKDELSVYFDVGMKKLARRDGTLDERVVQEMTGSHTWQALHVKEAKSSIRKST